MLEEGLCLVDPSGEYGFQQLTGFGGKKLKSTTKEGLEITDYENKKTEDLKLEFRPLRKLMKEHVPSQPFKGWNINGSLHMKIQTGMLSETLSALGAKVLVLLQNLQHP